MNEDLLEKTGLSMNAMGGTEMQLRRLFDRLPRELLEQVQIIPTRLTVDLDETKIRVLWCHDLVGDPALDFLKDKGWAKFHQLIFVSHWQLEHFVNAYQIPYSKCRVIPNGIVPIEATEKPTDGIRLIYTPTPHRGLAILAATFQALAEKHDDIFLDVYSGFSLYGWEERDKQYEPLYEQIRQMERATYHGVVSNDEVRAALQRSHIFAYPSTWQETSCQIKGALILTKQGVKEVQDIVVGDEVLTHKGRFRKVTETLKKEYKGKLYGIKAVGSHRPVHFTSEHPILIGHRNKRRDMIMDKAQGEAVRFYSRKMYDVDWISAEEVKAGRQCVVRPKFQFGSLTQISVMDYLGPDDYYEDDGKVWWKSSWHACKSVPNVIDLDEKFAFMLGLFAGDGSASATSSPVTFAHHINEEQNISFVRDYFEGDVTLVQTSENGCVTTYHNTVMARFLRNVVGVGRSKKIPDFIWDAPRDVQQAFVSGYYSADGNKNLGGNGRHSLTTISPSLAYGLVQLVTNLGHFPVLSYSERRTAYTVAWRETPSRKYFHEDENYFGAPITSVSEEDYEGTVYNLEVEEDHSYSTENMIAHNCLCLIEAMSAGCLAVHSSLAALPETSAGLTLMYPFNESVQGHASDFYGVLDFAINQVRRSGVPTGNAKAYADMMYNVERTAGLWTALLENLLPLPREFSTPALTYSTETGQIT